jgi:hypothetical protein
MPLPRSKREVELLTEGWPGDPGDFELAAFAATFRAGRPELSAQALDRIGQQVERELGRRDRLAVRKIALRATVLRFGRFAPIAAAAVVALAVGAWLHFRPGSPGGNGVPIQSVPVIQAQPAPSPDGATPPSASKPIVN